MKDLDPFTPYWVGAWLLLFNMLQYNTEGKLQTELQDATGGGASPSGTAVPSNTSIGPGVQVIQVTSLPLNNFSNLPNSA